MRLAPLWLLPFALPLVVAAPVPKTNLSPVESYSAAALAKWPFVNADEIPKEFQGKGAGPKPELVALAVSLPNTTFARGEPIEPLFVLKNRTDRPLGFDCLFDFTGGSPSVWNSAIVELRDAKTGQPVGPKMSQVLARIARDGPTLSENGYYVASGNIATGDEDQSLPAGDYELRWRYGWAQSNTVKFTVADRPFRGPARFKSFRLLHVTETDEREERELRKQLDEENNLSWDAAGVASLDLMAATVALGTGKFGQYYPSIRRLPETVAGLSANVKWNRDRQRDSFTLTLSVADSDPPVVISGQPHVYLLIETDAEAEAQALRGRLERQRLDERILKKGESFELKVTLPEDWTDEIAAPGPARVAVVVASHELDEGWGQQEKLKQAVQEDRTEFILRTAWRNLTVPKPINKNQERERKRIEKSP